MKGGRKKLFSIDYEINRKVLVGAVLLFFRQHFRYNLVGELRAVNGCAKTSAEYQPVYNAVAAARRRTAASSQAGPPASPVVYEPDQFLHG